MNKEKVLKEIPDRKGYFLDIDGNFYSQWINKGIHGLVIEGTPRMLKASVGVNGYVTITFGRNSKRIYIHRLMYEVFVGKIPNGLVIRHKNDIKTDNRLENLCIGTHKENMKDCIELGNFPRGEKCGSSKLKEKDVIEIRALGSIKNKTEIAKMYGVSRYAIRAILNKKTWKHI